MEIFQIPIIIIIKSNIEDTSCFILWLSLLKSITCQLSGFHLEFLLSFPFFLHLKSILDIFLASLFSSFQYFLSTFTDFPSSYKIEFSCHVLISSFKILLPLPLPLPATIPSVYVLSSFWVNCSKYFLIVDNISEISNT